MHKCCDIADPKGFRVPPGFDTVQGYIGERVPIRTPTPHIWTKAEWRTVGRGYRKYPMFVGTPAVGEHGHPVVEAFECLRNLYEIGVPKGKAVGLDMETAVNVWYVEQFYEVIHWAGYRLWTYGSAAYVFGNPVCDGYDPADWTGEPHFYNHTHVKATQYANAKQLGTNYDARLIKPYQWNVHLWR